MVIAIFIGFFTSCNTAKKTAKKKQIYIEQTYLELKKELPEAEVKLLMDTIKVLFPENLLFSFGKSEVKKDSYAPLEKLSRILNVYNKHKILITGYTDNVGEEEINEVLSKNRAENTKKILIQNQVLDSRLFTWGRGSKDPIASNQNVEGRNKNRRVEFVILYSYKPEINENEEK